MYRLVPDEISHDVIEALEQLLDGARSGEIEGVAFVVRLHGLDFFVNAAGTARSDPHPTRGFLLALQDELAQIAREVDATVTPLPPAEPSSG